MFRAVQQSVSGSVVNRGWLRVAVLACVSSACLIPSTTYGQAAASSPKQAGASAVATLPTAELATIIPPSVFFKGKLAPVQMRNSGAMRWSDGSMVWAAMVDTSGYASDVQEVYQFYFVTERPVTIGGNALPAGIYGAGVVNGKFGVLDVGGHMLLTAPTETDAALQRPRPLQLVASGPDAVRIYLGKRWVLVQSSR